MAATVSKAGPYYSSGEIKFSDLRRDFRAQVKKNSSGSSETINSSKNSGSIKASELLRITSTSNTNPVVPNATENSSIATSSNWKLSQFRNSIKFYYITQSGTDTNFDIDSQSWNSNLNKNINKVAFIDGTCGSTSTSSAAARFNATVYNLTIDVFGKIFGAGGAGGTSSSPGGGNGGNALRASSSGGNIVVNVRSSAKIYAGGGGGAKGATGAQGSSGTCVERTTKSACRNCPGCDGGWYNDGGCYDGWHCSRRQVCGCWGDCWWQSDGNTKYQRCRKDTHVPGGPGGEGGNGGHGRGYNHGWPFPLDGSVGAPGGGYGGCGGSWEPQPSNGRPGDTGANGGDWGQKGGDTNLASGGSPGKAIFGNNYTVTGSNGSTNIRGDY